MTAERGVVKGVVAPPFREGWEGMPLVPHPTVTVNAQVALPPLLSMARHTTVVIPEGKLEPLPMPFSRNTDCTVQLSVAVGVA